MFVILCHQLIRRLWVRFSLQCTAVGGNFSLKEKRYTKPLLGDLIVIVVLCGDNQVSVDRL